jgi:hypothetical protein
MTVFFIAFTILLLLGIVGFPKAISRPHEGNFLSREMTSYVNGYFIALVFLSHLKQYVPEEALGPLDVGYVRVINYLGQLTVATFFFFSGYGIMESIKTKGSSYIDALPLRRIFPFLLDVWIALPFYLALAPFRHVSVNVGYYLQVMVGWRAIGNSNWYIFAILCLWLITYASFRLLPRPNQRAYAVCLVFVFTALYCMLMRREEAGSRYYNTVFCYGAGMVLSLGRNLVMKVGKNRLLSIVGLVVALVATMALHRHARESIKIYNAMAIAFCCLTVFCMALTRASILPLEWAGKNLFFLYIYQRIPMILLAPTLKDKPFAFAAICLACVLGIAAVMSIVHRKIKAWLFQPSYVPSEG